MAEPEAEVVVWTGVTGNWILRSPAEILGSQPCVAMERNGLATGRIGVGLGVLRISRAVHITVTY